MNSKKKKMSSFREEKPHGISVYPSMADRFYLVLCQKPIYVGTIFPLGFDC